MLWNDTQKTALVKAKLEAADAVMIGAGAGLSTAAGFTYSGERFEKNFPDFIKKYGFRDMYSGGFYPFDSLEEHWAYWSRYIMINRYGEAENNTYELLLDIVRDKEYFVLTTNVDHQFIKAGFDKKRLFYTQGDFGLFQCSEPCHSKTYDNEAIIRKMTEKQENMRIPSELVPHCPECGKPMSMNLRADDTFVQDKGWYEAAARCDDFINAHRRDRMVFLELGVGYNTPAIIKYPFCKMTAQNPLAQYICVNLEESFCPDEIEPQSVLIAADIYEFLKSLSQT